MSNCINEIIENGEKFYNQLKLDVHGRYLSWEHCYKTFNDSRELELTEEVIDRLCLHLSFYLASWGMYRGSSFLLQKDYKVHNEAIKEIFKDEYNNLWGIECKEYFNEENQIVLDNLTSNLRNIYSKIRSSAKQIDIKMEVSDTLITKILMGTLGCVPAYDRYFVTGIREYKIAPGTYGINSILNLCQFYQDNFEYFEKTRKNMKIGNLIYPQMKVIDMCMWQIGYELDKKYNILPLKKW